jgi:TusA-related sulfurtransferase
MKTGEVLRVVATDPASQRDFQAFARQTGNALVDQSAANGEFIFLLRRK